MSESTGHSSIPQKYKGNKTVIWTSYPESVEKENN